MASDIEEMKCFVFRIAQKRWHMAPQKCAALFAQFNIYAFIQNCYDILHLSSYESVVNDIETMLANEGVRV